MTTPVTSGAGLRAAIANIPDPELPAVTILDLGILRETVVDEQLRTVTVLITPTYSGCPAMQVIRQRIEHIARREGYVASVQTRLTPAWTTDWVSSPGRDKLRAFGIAPPDQPSKSQAGSRSEAESGEPSGVGAQRVGVSIGMREVACPLCGSAQTEVISQFGSSACKALRRCRECREPFDEFKTI